MAIISFDKDTLTDYVPEYGGNRDSDNPCIVRLKFVPYARVQEYSRVLAAKTKGTDDIGKRTEVLREVQRKQFVESVGGVSGYFIGTREVTDVSELYDTAPADLIYELLRAMEDANKLNAGQRKN